MWFRVGLVAIVLSVVPWLAIAVAPLLGLSLARSAGLVGAAWCVAEVLFWSRPGAGRQGHLADDQGPRLATRPRELARLLVSGRRQPGSSPVTPVAPGVTGKKAV